MRVYIAREAIIEYAKTHQCAVWDLYGIMGGTGSMSVWVKQKLAAKDYVHFSGAGYKLQGNLLFNALDQTIQNAIH